MNLLFLPLLAVGCLGSSISNQAIDGGRSQEEIAATLTEPPPTYKVDDRRPGRPVIGLSIHEHYATDDVLKRLPAFPELEELQLVGCGAGLRTGPCPGWRVTDVGVANLRGLKRLRLLVIPSFRVTDSGLSFLSEMAQLEEITLGNDSGWIIPEASKPKPPDEWTVANITDAGLERMCRLPKLRSFTILGTRITDDGLKPLQRLTQLRELHVVLLDGGITPLGLAHLAKVSTLRSLDITDFGSSSRASKLDSSLACLTQLPVLEALSIFSCDVTDAGLIHIGQVKTLRNLALYHALATMPVTDSGLQHLKALCELRWLRLGISCISDKSLDELSALRKLEILDISSLTGSSITDSGLQHLSRLPSLRELRILPSVSVTNKGLAQLRKSLPDLKILERKH